MRTIGVVSRRRRPIPIDLLVGLVSLVDPVDVRTPNSRVGLHLQVPERDIGKAGSRAVAIQIQVILTQSLRCVAVVQGAVQRLDHDLSLSHQFWVIQIERPNHLVGFRRTVTGDAAR